MEQKLELFRTSDGVVTLPVSVQGESVWLTQAQMASLFDKDQSVIARHVRNAADEGEIDLSTMYAKNAYLGRNVAGVKYIGIYNLDVIISVGYRVHSQRGVEFRRWATRVLKEYLVKGCAVNRERMRQLGQAA